MTKTDEKDVSSNGIEATEAQKTWQEYLQKCCEHGQLQHAMEELDGQRNALEKQIEITMRAVKSLATKHKENKAQGLVPTPTVPTTIEEKAQAH